MKRALHASPLRCGSAMSSKLRRRGAVGALVASAVAFTLALPAFASAGPVGEVTFYDAGIRSTADITSTTKGPDGNVWFVDAASQASSVSGLGKIGPTGEIAEYVCGETLSGCNPEARLQGITAAPGGDARLWFTDRSYDTPAIGRIDPASPGAVEEFSIEAEGGDADSAPWGIVADAEGRLWYTDVGTESMAIGVFDPSAPEGERVEEFSTGLLPATRPRGIVVGSDGALWFTDTGYFGAIGRIDPDTHEIEEFELGIGTIPGGDIHAKSGIVAGPDGDIWFTEAKAYARGVCKIEVAEPHDVECFSEGLKTPNAQFGSKPYALTVADGELWFTDHSAHNENQFFIFGNPGNHWTEGDEFELCNEGESSCATGAYKDDPGENSAQVLNALESIYGASNVTASGNTELKVTAKFVGELTITNIGQTSCRRVSGAGVGCSGWTQADGGPDAIGRVNEYNEIIRYPIEGLTDVSSITHVSGGDVWFSATHNGVKSIGKLGIEVTDQPLTLKINQGEGTVVSDPARIECTGSAGESCEAEFEEGDEVTLTASPAAGHRFWYWEGCPSPEGHKCTVTISEAEEVGVRFLRQHDLTVTRAAGSEPGLVLVYPGGGSSPVFCNYSCSSATYSYPAGKVVTVAAYEYPGIHRHFVEFKNGTGDAEVCNGQTGCTFPITETDSSVEAQFEFDPKFTLSIEKAGGGTAFIESHAGIWCEHICGDSSARYFAGEKVTVTWKLVIGTSSIDWGSGAGTCTGSFEEAEGSCEVTMSEATELVATLE